MKIRLVMLLVAVLVAFVAAGQAERSDEKAEIALFADFGFAGKTPTGRNTPVRVWVQAAEDHIAGRVELEYTSQQGMAGRIVSPVDVAAGKATSVSMVVPMPEWCESVRLTLRSTSGARLAETTYTQNQSSTTLQLPPMLSSDEELLLSLTPRVGADRITTRFVKESIELRTDPGAAETRTFSSEIVRLSEPQRRFDVMSRVVGTNALLDQLPLAGGAYEGVLAVIADESTVRSADPRAIAAIHRWVLGGGRLVVLAHQPGGTWRALLPPGVPVEAIEVGARQELVTPDELGAIAERDVFPRVQAAPMSLGLLAEEVGWHVRWTTDEGALVVEGPAGLGWVTVVAVLPESVGAGESEWRLWLDLLSPAIGAVASRDGEARSLHNAPGWRYSRSLSRAMPAVVFDAIGESTTIGPAAVALVALVTISLAIALGPIDFFLLKIFRLRHLAWLSALIWILLASGIAVVAPNRLRAGPSVVSRLVMQDAILPNGALGDGDTHPGQRGVLGLPQELRGWTTGMTYFFAGSSEVFEIEDASGLWFEYAVSMHDAVVSRPTTVSQLPASGGIEAVRTSTPTRVAPRIWSVSTFIDQGAAPSDLGVSLAYEELDWVLDVAGLGSGAKILNGQLRLGDRFYRLGHRYRVRYDGERARIVFESDLGSLFSAQEWGDPYRVDQDRPYTRSWMHAGGVDELMPAALLELPGMRERSTAIDAYLATGRYALVSLVVMDQPMDIAVSAGELKQSRASLYRLVVPIEGGSGRD